MFFEKMAKTHQPKHNKSSKKKKSYLVERQNSNAFFFFFFCMQPIRTKTSEPEKTSDKIIKGISLENQACKSSQLSVGQRLTVQSMNPD